MTIKLGDYMSFINKIKEKPIVSYIVILFLAMLVVTLVQVVSSGILKVLTPEYSDMISVLISVVITFILYAYIVKFKKVFSFSNSKLALILAIPSIVLIISNLLEPSFVIPASLLTLGTAIGLGLVPGISEELIFRGLLISYFMKRFKSSNGIYFIILFSALSFGLTHLANAFVGAPLDYTIFQAFGTIGLGVILAAIYLRTGNIWIPILIHAILDITAFCTNDITVQGVVQIGFVLNLSNIISIVGTIIAIVFGLYYVRSAKHDDILKVWEDKWAN